MKILTKRIITILLVVVIGMGISIIAWVIITPSQRGISDKTSPTSSLSYTPESIPNIISNSTTFTLLADDGNGTGVDSIEYRIDNGEWTSYTGPFTLEGYTKRNHTIYYFSTDNAGNEETINSEIVNLDIPYIYSGVLFAPGVPIDIPEDRIIKIGTLADFTHISGESTFQGSYSAIKQINEDGGINITQSTDEAFPNGTYYFGIIGENTYEAEPLPDVSKGVLAADKLMNQHQPDFVIGGFGTESVMTYLEIILDEQKIFINTGAAFETFCAMIGSDYARYKYLFRTMPINLTSFSKELIKFYALALKPAMEAAQPGLNVTKVAIIREDLVWTVPMSYVLNGYYAPYGFWGLNSNPIFNFTIEEEITFPITATALDFAVYLNMMEMTGVQIVFPLLSTNAGIKLMQLYNTMRPKFIIAGLDYMSQLGDYWYQSEGGCNYEIIMQSTTRTNKTSLTIAMWDSYVYMWDMDPFYTGIGSYDSIFMLLDAIEATQSIDSDAIVAELENLTPENPTEGAGGWVGFNEYHDLYEGYDIGTGKIYGVTLWAQWQSGGTKSILSSGGYIYPEWIVDAPIQMPPWGINT
ncbi:MAG: OmpL47-type beta-barrel domain-containing protein [Promethearchaeota archaeon]